MHEVNTKELELQILKSKIDKVSEHTKNLCEQINKDRVDKKIVIEELCKDRKELVDCVALELGFELVGPAVAGETIKVILQIDTHLLELRMLESLGL